MARVLLRVGSIAAATGCFHLCVPDPPGAWAGAGALAGAGLGQGVFLRVVSKNYRVALPEAEPACSAPAAGAAGARRWAAAVKVSFSLQGRAPATATAAAAAAAASGAGAGGAAGVMARGATKAYARVPLQPHELDEVRRALLTVRPYNPCVCDGPSDFTRRHLSSSHCTPAGAPSPALPQHALWAVRHRRGDAFRPMRVRHRYRRTTALPSASYILSVCS